MKYTLQGTPPASGTVPPTADSGTGASTRIEGVIPTLSGLSANAGIYPTSPTMWQGGYYNNNVGTHLSYGAIYTALKNLWQSTTTNPGAFRADPAEIISSGIDIANLSNDVINQGAGTNYQLFIQQGGVGDVTVGAAVSQFQNPLTRILLKMVVHPWYTQGNATLLSYQLPQTWTNVANAWEVSTVQDYVSIAWPVIDATFRYSIFSYDALVSHAPWYSAHLSGLQNSDSTPYSRTSPLYHHPSQPRQDSSPPAGAAAYPEGKRPWPFSMSVRSPTRPPRSFRVARPRSSTCRPVARPSPPRGMSRSSTRAPSTPPTWAGRVPPSPVTASVWARVRS